MPSCAARSDKAKCPYPESCHEWETDAEAWGYLQARGYTAHRFLIKFPKQHISTEKEWAAICYLVNEWDWGVDGESNCDGKEDRT